MLFKPVRMAYTKKRRKKEGRNMAYITFEQIKNDSTVATYIRQADIALKAYGLRRKFWGISATRSGKWSWRKSPDFCMISGTASIGWTMPKAAP